MHWDMLLTTPRMQDPDHFLPRSFLRSVLVTSILERWDNSLLQYKEQTFLILTVKATSPQVLVFPRFGTCIPSVALNNRKEWAMVLAIHSIYTLHMDPSAVLLRDLKINNDRGKCYDCCVSNRVLGLRPQRFMSPDSLHETLISSFVTM